MPFVFGTDNPEIIPSKMQRLRAYIGIRSTVFFVKQYWPFNNLVIQADGPCLIVLSGFTANIQKLL